MVYSNVSEYKSAPDGTNITPISDRRYQYGIFSINIEMAITETFLRL